MIKPEFEWLDGGDYVLYGFHEDTETLSPSACAWLVPGTEMED